MKSETKEMQIQQKLKQFQSTHSMKSETLVLEDGTPVVLISIHSLNEE